jgi:type II secretory pathway component PulF
MKNTYQVKYINKDGERITREVDARNEFEAVQLAGAFGLTVLSVINLDL